MKNISQKTKIIAGIIALIIIAGIAVTVTIGLNFDIRYQEAKKIQLYLNQEFEITDMKQITDEVLPNQKVVLQKVEVFEDTVSIVTNEITEEQKTEIINKVNEKYGTELAEESIEITTIPHTRGRDIIRPYLVPFAIATVIILVYICVRYYQLGMAKTFLKTVALLVVAEATLLSVMAIARIPIGRLTIPLAIAVYLLALFGLTTCFEKKLKEMKEEEK